MLDTLTIPSATRHLARVRGFITKRAMAAGLSEDDVAELRLAVDEACSNAIEHAYAGREDGTVTIETRIEGEWFVVSVSHSGIPFDPETYEPLALPEAMARGRIGGFGVTLMRCLCDAVEYDRNDSVSEVRLMKRLPSSAPP